MQFHGGIMKLKNVFLGGILFLTLNTWAVEGTKAQVNVNDEMGRYVIKDVTHLYPRNNFFEQLQECNETGISGVTEPVIPGQPPFNNVIGPITAPGNTGNIGGIGSGGFTPNDPGGGIIIQPPGLDPGGIGIGGGIGGGGIGIPGGGLGLPGTIGVVLDQIINVGNFAWQIVERGRPSMRVSVFRAHGLPKGVTCWTDLEEWKIPKSKVFTVEQRSKLGQPMAKFTFRISFVYGGHFNGTGQYLANVAVSPVDLNVFWGTDFASEVHIPTVFNMGTKANPLAAMQVYVYWGVGNVGTMKQKSSLFHVMGNGKIEVTPQE
jgi:hypothetical protein